MKMNSQKQSIEGRLPIINHLITQMLMSGRFDNMIINRVMIDSYIKNLTDSGTKRLLDIVLSEYDKECMFIICYMKTINDIKIKQNLYNIIKSITYNNKDYELYKLLLEMELYSININKQYNDNDKDDKYNHNNKIESYMKTHSKLIINYLYERHNVNIIL